jgi:NAD(P)-dependent dehydrogenase (short-subunit alcohol dehydrogenase family)
MGVLEQFRLGGKVAVVTGGAGLFGRQIVQGLAEAGAKVIVASRDLAKIQQQSDEMRARGLEVEALSLDQGSKESIEGLLAQIAGRGAGVDILVNNAVLRTMGGWSSDSEKFAQSMAVNATGLFLMMRTFGDHMAGRGGGSIINIGSIQGSVGPDFSLYEGLNMDAPPDYFFHKGGLLQLTRYAAAKLGPRGVRVNAISPGGFLAGQDPTFVERYCARTLLKRMANDTDLAGITVFLASDASAYITGANIAVDGGYTAI